MIEDERKINININTAWMHDGMVLRFIHPHPSILPAPSIHTPPLTFQRSSHIASHSGPKIKQIFQKSLRHIPSQVLESSFSYSSSTFFWTTSGNTGLLPSSTTTTCPVPAPSALRTRTCFLFRRSCFFQSLFTYAAHTASISPFFSGFHVPTSTFGVAVEVFFGGSARVGVDVDTHFWLVRWEERVWGTRNVRVGFEVLYGCCGRLVLTVDKGKSILGFNSCAKEIVLVV